MDFAGWVALLLNEWLHKRFSRSQFDMGLDVEFRHPTSALPHRQELLSKYAAKDCLAMQKILIAISRIKRIQPTKSEPNPSEHKGTKRAEPTIPDFESIDQLVRRTNLGNQPIDQSTPRTVRINRATTMIDHLENRSELTPKRSTKDEPSYSP